MTHPACLPIEKLLSECSVRRTRGSGPGGQHRNKVETAIVITHVPTGIAGQASEKCSQNKNREVAIERLRVNLALAVGSKSCPDALSSPLWRSRVKSRKIQVSPKHTDFPALLAEAFDFVSDLRLDVAATANRLGVSTSQLIKFFKSCPAAFALLNREREIQGLKPLS